MSWRERSLVILRREFVLRARQPGACIAALCRQYEISRKTGYKWLRRAQADPDAPLTDRPRTPRRQPRRTPAAVEAAVVAMRGRYPCWGARKLARKLAEAGVTPVPAPSTITTILQRHGLLPPRQRRPGHAPQRFEHAAPHEMWQMDFMGHLALADGTRVHPLVIVDDHSRTLLCLAACPNEQREVVWDQLCACFARYGLPRAILTDNGPPWGTSGGGGMTRLEARLLRLGIELRHGRSYHPQTQGKVERLHQTIRVEVVGTRQLASLPAAQAAFDTFRSTYNEDRPHEALAYAVPITRLRPSPRPWPATLPEPVYAPDDMVRRVRGQGAIAVGGRSWFVSRGLIGERVAIRPTAAPGGYSIWFCHKEVGRFNLHRPHDGVTPVSEHLSPMSPV